MLHFKYMKLLHTHYKAPLRYGPCWGAIYFRNATSLWNNVEVFVFCFVYLWFFFVHENQPSGLKADYIDYSLGVFKCNVTMATVCPAITDPRSSKAGKDQLPIVQHYSGIVRESHADGVSNSPFPLNWPLFFPFTLFVASVHDTGPSP